MKGSNWFAKFTKTIARVTGKSVTFCVAIAMIAIWAVTGPIFQFSDTWQLVINTSTTIITFLMVFIIQNTQNRDTEALQLKMDELIRISSGKNALLDIEELTQEELDDLQKQYCELARQAREEKNEKRNVEQQQQRNVNQKRQPKRKKAS